jgi:hypothetical protein
MHLSRMALKLTQQNWTTLARVPFRTGSSWSCLSRQQGIVIAAIGFDFLAPSLLS